MNGTLPKRNVRADVSKLDDKDRAIAVLLYSLGFPQHRIASLFGCNSGRIAEAVKPFRGNYEE